jgi:hypothetical protein
VVLTSDLPLMNWFPGNSFFTNTVMPYAEMFWTSLGKLFSSRYVTFGLLISVSAGLLFTLDQYFGKRFSRHQNAA